jgi:hypothetical protein
MATSKEQVTEQTTPSSPSIIPPPKIFQAVIRLWRNGQMIHQFSIAVPIKVAGLAVEGDWWEIIEP